MPSEAIILCSKEPEGNDINLAKLLDFFGVKHRFIYLGIDTLRPGQLRQHFKDDDPCILLNCKVIATLQRNGADDTLRSVLLDNVSYVLVYDISPNDSNIKALNYLTGGIIESVSSFKTCNYQYEVNKDYNDISRQFSGLTFGPINNETDYNFGMKSDSEGAFNLISIDSHPFFAQMNIRKCALFLIASNRVLDINAKSSGVSNTHEFFSQIVPEMMFIKYVFKDKCWHSNTNYASLIIDDLLLKENYGFLNYRKLLHEMDEHNFSTSVAFIPWNFKRTSKRVADLFKERPDRFTICVHGCDHIGSEFGTTDSEKLNSRIKLATERMIAHENSNGLKFDKVMIFPQGIFSTMAMQVLKTNNYLAALNSNATPVNKSEGLEISCFFESAITIYESFPLFLRRYPENFLDFIFDLFIGKPAFIVTHHNNFKEGYHNITDLIDKINSVSKDIQWTGIGTVIKKTYLEREDVDGTIHCKIYGNTVFIKNQYERSKTYIIAKDEMGNIPIKHLLVNGKKSSYKSQNNRIILIIEIGPGETVQIELVYEDNIPCLEINRDIRQNMRIWMRQHASEFRDNIISKNNFLLSLVCKLKKQFFSK